MMRLRRPGAQGQEAIRRPESPFRKHRAEFVPVEAIQRYAKKMDEVEREGYKVKLGEKVLGGFKVDVISPDGRELAKGLAVRRFFKKEVWDPQEEKRIRIDVYDADRLPTVSVIGPPFVIRSADDIQRAIDLFSDADGYRRMWAPLILGSCVRDKVADIRHAIPALSRALSDEFPPVRLNAASALIDIARDRVDISEAVSALRTALHGQDKRLRSNAALALALVYLNAGDKELLAELEGHPDRGIMRLAKAISELPISDERNSGGPYR